MVVRELELDLDAFEGPFDLLLTLVLKDELELVDVDVAEIVVAFVERLAERSELNLEASGEFLVLVAALLELKARGLFPDEEAELAELDPDEAAEELARRLAAYRRMKSAAAWLADHLATEGDRYFRVGPAPLAPRPERRVAPQPAELLATALRALAAEPPAVSLAHMALRFPPVEQFLERFRAVLRRRAAVDFDAEVAQLTRIEQAVAFLALLELRKAGEVSLEQAKPLAPIRVSRARPAAAPAGRSPAPPQPAATEAAEAAVDSTRRQRGTVPSGSVLSTTPSGPAPAATTRAGETAASHRRYSDEGKGVAWNARSA